MNIILIGFMGCGKSTVAKCLSRILNMSWIEMDDLVYQRTNTRDMHEVFMKGGELLLRETEIAIAKEYSLKENLIISTGGGVVLNKIILDYFKATDGKIIFLHIPLSTAIKRLESDNSRPLFKDVAVIEELYDLRHPLYMHYADEVIDACDQSPEAIALQIKGFSNGF